MTCPKCGAPAGPSAPDGDFRYRPPVDHTREIMRLVKALRSIADINLGPDRASGEYRCTEAAAIAAAALNDPA